MVDKEKIRIYNQEIDPYSGRILEAKFQARLNLVRECLPNKTIRPDYKDGQESIVFTGAKLYYLGGGNWKISGYSQTDVFDFLELLYANAD